MIQAIQNIPISRYYEGVINQGSQLIGSLFQKTLGPVAGYFLKVCLFREAALQDPFSRWVFTPVAKAVGNFWMRLQGLPAPFVSFDPARLQKSADFLAEFAEMRELRTEDGTLIKWALFTPQSFDQWVEKNGGIREGEWIRPRTENDWQALQRLREFKAFKEVGHAFKIPAPIPNAKLKCILRCNGFGLSIPTDKSFIGLHLAAGFHYAIFEWRTEVSTKGFFQDAESAFQAILKEGFIPRQIKPIGYCGSSYVVAHLKELHHHERLDVIMIGPHTSLKDVIQNTVWPANRIGLLGLPAVENNGVDFDNIRKFRSLRQGPASTCLIMRNENKIGAVDTVARLAEAVRLTGQCDLILKPENCPDSDFDFNKQFRNEEVLGRYFLFLTR